ncbi:MAG: PEP-CTERM sorting domain-containing protein [Planctomycetota bacterium]
MRNFCIKLAVTFTAICTASAHAAQIDDPLEPIDKQASVAWDLEFDETEQTLVLNQEQIESLGLEADELDSDRVVRVPEPQSVVLLAVGALLIARRRERR